MLTVDYLIVNSDRHFNNFGAVRNAETLEWFGPAPIFDCGTSMWHDRVPQMIRPALKNPSKPFRNDHNEQIKLVGSFDWLNLDALNGIEEEYSDLLKQSAFIDEERRSKLCFALQMRVKLLKESLALTKRNDQLHDMP
jgi:hypothetical protein